MARIAYGANGMDAADTLVWRAAVQWRLAGSTVGFYGFKPVTRQILLSGL